MTGGQSLDPTPAAQTGCTFRSTYVHVFHLQGSARIGREQGGGRGGEEGPNRGTSSSARASELTCKSLANKVSDIRSRFDSGVSCDKGKAGADKSSHISRHPSRGKEFSQLLHKFSSTSEASSSDRSDSDSAQRRRVPPAQPRGARGEATSSSDDALSDCSRRTPERSHSLKLVRSANKEEGGEEKGKKAERSGSFKSVFMTKRFPSVHQSDAPSAELSAVLSRRHREVERQKAEQEEESEGDRRGDRRQARAERFKAAAVEEVIADSEVAAVLKARRKETDSKLDVQSRSQPGLSTIDQSLAVLARVTDELQDNKESSPETERLAPAARTEPTSSRRKDSGESLKEAEQYISGVQTRIASSLHLKDSNTGSNGHAEAATEKPHPSATTVSYTVTLAAQKAEERLALVKDNENMAAVLSLSGNNGSGLTDKAHKERPRGLVREPLGSGSVATKTSTPDKQQAGSAATSLPGPSSEGGQEKASCTETDQRSSEDAGQETHSFTTTSSTFSPVVSADLRSPSSETATSSLSSSASSSSGLRRAESLKEESAVKRSESFERRKGILKRTPSMPRQESGPVIDPQLARIMEQRRQKVLELEAAGEEEEGPAAGPGRGRQRTLSAAEEIEESIRQMREGQQSKAAGAEQLEEEAALCMSVTERIFRMQGRIEEERHTGPATPRSRSGAATPKSARSWSGSITPHKQMSVDEGVSEVIPEESAPVTAAAKTPGSSASKEEMSGLQLMERLHTLAAKSAEFEERRHKFQKRQREDWRTRTQPVTLEEIHQADRLSLAEKVKLFSQKQKEEKEAASAKPPSRTDAPVPRRRHRKLQPSRFNTQPVTPEELEKASKISPLAMSLVKPPDPELLMGLKLKDQQELMMLHAEATLSQCSSRSGSRPSSQPGSRRGSFTTPDTLPAAGANTTVSEKGSERLSSSTSKMSTETKATSGGREQASSHGDLCRTDSEPRGILKKTKSTESVPSDSAFKPAQTAATATEESRSGDATKHETEGDGYSPVADLVLPAAAAAMGAESEVTTTFFLTDEDMGGESSTDLIADVDVTPASTSDSRRRSRFAERKSQADRYLTQPAPQLTPERSPQPKRKYEGRHMTQPITPDEMKEAESATTPTTKVSGGSIADRLNQLKTSGEENWKRRVTKDSDTPVLDIKLREKKGLAAVRPVSISDRLCKLEVSAEQWKERVEETDAKHFTVANKISKTHIVTGSESPLVAKIRASSKKDLTKLDDSSNASSPVTSPSTPTKEFLPKVPLPKEIIADPVAVKKAEETKAKQKMEPAGVDSGMGEGAEPVCVKVPQMDEAEIEEFFSTKEITEISDKVDIDIDDFNNIFIEANEILPHVKKIQPTRKKRATSRNPLKTMSQFVEIQTEYIQINTGAAEKQQRKLKTEGLKREADFAVEALAGLASKENFSKVELRKTDSSSLPASLALRQNPFSDLMLLHIKGRRNVQTRLVEPSGKSMNAGDCYILVTPDKITTWVGEFSNVIEKAKAAEVASFIQQKRDMGYKSTAAVQTVDQVKDHLGAGKHFWAVLRGDKECQACGPEEEDELYESSIIKTNMVYRLMDGALHPYEQYWGTIPKHEMLGKKEVLVFDFGTEFYVWQGKGVSFEERKQGMALAQKLWSKGYDYSECAVNPMAPLRSEEDGGIPVKASQRPDWAIFGKVNQNMETILFREKFADWPDTSRIIGVKGHKAAELKSEFADIKAFDAKKMTPVNDSPVTLVLEGAHVGRGKKWQEDMQGFIKEQDILTLGVKVWHVLEYDHFHMPKASYGQFHRGDTYVVRWQYMITNAGLKSLKGQAARHTLTGRERCAYFFWQGQDSTINEKGASALMTVELDEERGPQIRVVQGKEPPCFLNLFEGSMIVHIGKREDAATNTVGPWRLYCVRGDEAGEVCLLEIPVSIANLRSRSSLVLLNTHTGITYIWHGVKSPKHTRQLAVNAVKTFKERRPLELDLHKDAHIVLTEVEEGEEKVEIWTALGCRDRSLYHSLLRDPLSYDYTPRLFYMTSVSMVFEVTEQMNPARLPGVTTPFPFFQADLYKASQPALFLLDVGSCVYLWQGWWPVGDEEVENVHTGSATARYNTDRRCAMETTLNYCRERSSEDKIPKAYLVCAGVEPLAFQNLFPYWEPDTTVHSLALQEGRRNGYCELVEDVYTKLTQTRYTLEELQERPLPEGVDPLRLESYLPDEEFEEVLEMKRDEFYALPTWKQRELKQCMGLF